MLTDKCCLWLVVGIILVLVHEPSLLLPRRPAPTSSSARPRLRPPGISRRPPSRPWGTGHWPSGVWGSQWHILLQINPFPCCTWFSFGRLAALLNYDIWEDRWRAKGVVRTVRCKLARSMCNKGILGCVSVPGGGGSSSVGGGIRDLFGSKSSKSFITWLVLSLLFLRFFSSSRA